ncbi:HPr kinase/phosphorylase [Roseibium sp. TrichSKD4]|uniref:HPr kinase/phosphorylase n=1 Tax=Roseibium sp. TrichSKD4 TaxID=744980 RepID=UPI0001E56761|nr:HPr kinase/phosphorylase [Roseibium sp. TrichSKD4]EFO32846.1 HPr kinase/phosphorylase [Roseibium sp. TrichSKD4]
MTRSTIHASAVVLGTIGILVRGASAAGKSSFCDRLVEASCNKGHYAAWVADDRVLLSSAQGRVIAVPPPPLAGKLEVRGLGIIETAYAREAVMDLVVDLQPLSGIERLPDTELTSEYLENISLPVCRLAENRFDEGIRRLRWVIRRLFPKCPDYF